MQPKKISLAILSAFLAIPYACMANTGITSVSTSQKNRLIDEQIINPPSQLGAGEAFLTNMIVDPTVESATYTVDTLNDPVIRATKIPIQHKYDLAGRNWNAISRINMGYMKINQTAINTPWGGFFKPSWEGGSFTVGGGAEIPLNKRWTLVPTFDAGIARFRNKTKFFGDINNNILQPAFDEYAITNWKSQAGIFSAALAVDYQRKIGEYTLDSRLLYAISSVKTFRESGQLRAFDEQVDSAAARINIKRPLGISLLELPLSGVLHLGANSFVGGDKNALGFSEYGEVGASLIVDMHKKKWLIDNFSIGVKGIYGQDVRGWSFLLDYNI